MSEDPLQDSGSAFGHLRSTAGETQLTLKQERFRAYMDHSMDCADCDYGNRRCDAATDLWAKWRAV
ncbi:hypothetical protein AB0D14_20295 [Streptomyces sp. NPDC048484]|uniref:hypothetical protein n=1 Tax=Streptomyces sp. NPDC048484 TaxID=3155146 RepID=UPI003431CACD